MQEYKSPTNMVWILGRIYCTGAPEDYKAVHELQDKLSLVPLSSFGQPFTPPTGKVDPSIDMKKAVRDQVNELDIGTFFNMLAELMKDNPPTAADVPMLVKMAKLGLAPGKPFDLGKLDPAVAKSIQDVPKLALERISAEFRSIPPVNGWTFITKTGVYGTDYLQRALIAVFGLGANLPQDAIYPASETDVNGAPYEGANKYVLHFGPGQMPPVKGFWSLTMYDDQMFFVPNPLNRYNLSQRNKFNTNPDGSIDLYLQHENPGPDKEANWLPAPAGRFIPMFRFYWPDEAIIDGTWKPPAIQKVTQ